MSANIAIVCPSIHLVSRTLGLLIFILILGGKVDLVQVLHVLVRRLDELVHVVLVVELLLTGLDKCVRRILGQEIDQPVHFLRLEL